MGVKTCSGCREDKPITDFSLRGTAPDGRMQRCRDCRAAAHASMTPEQHAAHKARVSAHRKRPEVQRRIRDLHLQKEFGITLADYEARLTAQGHVCAICKQPETKRQKGTLQSLAVDHCHSTGKIRGLLCYRCNLILGHVQDDPALLQHAAAYLKQSTEAVTAPIVRCSSNPRSHQQNHQIANTERQLPAGKQ